MKILDSVADILYTDIDRANILCFEIFWVFSENVIFF